MTVSYRRSRFAADWPPEKWKSRLHAMRPCVRAARPGILDMASPTADTFRAEIHQVWRCAFGMHRKQRDRLDSSSASGETEAVAPTWVRACGWHAHAGCSGCLGVVAVGDIGTSSCTSRFLCRPPRAVTESGGVRADPFQCRWLPCLLGRCVLATAPWMLGCEFALSPRFSHKWARERPIESVVFLALSFENEAGRHRGLTGQAMCSLPVHRLLVSRMPSCGYAYCTTHCVV